MLKKLGELSSTRGKGLARKADGIGRNLEPAEELWVREVLKKLIYRLAERIAMPQGELGRITMDELPELGNR